MVDTLNAQVVLYKAKSGKTELKVHFEKDSVWLSQEQIAILF